MSDSHKPSNLILRFNVTRSAAWREHTNDGRIRPLPKVRFILLVVACTTATACSGFNLCMPHQHAKKTRIYVDQGSEKA